MKYGEGEHHIDRHYEDIHMPKNSPIGILIAGFTFVLCFGLIWHIYWLVPVSLLGIISCVLRRSFDYDIDYVVPAAEVKKIEERYMHKH